MIIQYMPIIDNLILNYKTTDDIETPDDIKVQEISGCQAVTSRDVKIQQLNKP